MNITQKEEISNINESLETPVELKEWRIIIDLIKSTDVGLFIRLSRKMMNYLCWIGIAEAKSLLQSFDVEKTTENLKPIYETNKPSLKKDLKSIIKLSDVTFWVSSQHLSDIDILTNIKKWIKEDKLSFLVKTLKNLDSSLNDIFDAITRFHVFLPEKVEFPPHLIKNINVLLINRFLTDQLDYINIAKNYVSIDDFYEMMQHSIAPNNSHGKFGGKSAGMFLAHKILSKSEKFQKEFSDVKIPKTWYLTSDAFQYFLYYNNLEELVDQKYKNIDEIREEYPNIVQIIKNSYFPPEIVKGMKHALEDFGNKPLVIRSSSLLEDRMGTAFSGKYKSLFLGNQGSLDDRLSDLMDAVAEVYASTYSPDALEYRKEKGLIDFSEEMAVMMQEVIGAHIGKYYFPIFAGVAFGNNDFRWASRIKREDGLLRVVCGLGTRAVDRLSNDYPTLISPGQVNIRVNITNEEILKYSQKYFDIINLEKNTFETISGKEIIKEFGNSFPEIENVISIFEDNLFSTKHKLNIDFEKDEFEVTYDGLISKTNLIKKIGKILEILKQTMGTHADIEFAYDGKDLYILQCRAQSFTKENLPSIIPQDIPNSDIIFTAKKFINNAKIPDISHIVYVDAEKYSQLESIEKLKDVGKVVGLLNDLLPKGKFVLIGPGRWGSRGDIKLGVSVTYSDIKNTSMLIEVARKKENYVPDLSFGTHFFQDLVESNIKYLPLFPDDEDIKFNEKFLKSNNILSSLIMDYSYLSDSVFVIDIPRSTNGRILKILLNAEKSEAMGFIETPSNVQEIIDPNYFQQESQKENHWKWRLQIAETIAFQTGNRDFKVEEIYLFGSTKSMTASSTSDIDLLVVHNEASDKVNELISWFDGWSSCLSEINYLRTGIRKEGLLDIHLINSDDLKHDKKILLKYNTIKDFSNKLFTNTKNM